MFKIPYIHYFKYFKNIERQETLLCQNIYYFSIILIFFFHVSECALLPVLKYKRAKKKKKKPMRTTVCYSGVLFN